MNSQCIKNISSKNISLKKSNNPESSVFIDYKKEIFLRIYNDFIPAGLKYNWDCFTFSRKISLDIFNNKFYLPVELSEIGNQIKEAYEQIIQNDYRDDFESTDETTFLNAVRFLISYAQEISKTNILVTPYIDFAKDGSVFINFESKLAKFLIIFKKENNNAYYYGESLNSNIPLKSGIEINDKIDEILLLWMKNNLMKQL